MNLQKLFNTQRELDNRIVKQHGLEGQDLLPQKILALQVELGECANEWRGFKFWSKNQNPNLYKEEIDIENDRFRSFNPLLEEYVDCLHFILSIGLEHKFEEMLPLAIEDITCADITNQYSMLLRTDWEIYEEGDGGYYHEGLELFIGLGEMLGFTWEQIEQAYYDKNKINHTRQDTGY